MEMVHDSSSSGANGIQKHQSQHHDQEQEEYEQELHQQLRRAQRCLLQRKYDETISICSNYFQTFTQRNHGKSLEHCQVHDNNNVIKLKCEIRRPYIDVDEFDVHVNCCDGDELDEPTMLDQMMAIGLQAVEEKDIELQTKESSFIWNRKRHQPSPLWKDMIESLSISSIGLEAFCVWMQFWQARGLWKEALQWNASVLCRHSKAFVRGDPIGNINEQVSCGPQATTISPHEELWIECLTKQVPRIRDPKRVVELLDYFEQLLRKNQQGQFPKKAAPDTLDWDSMETAIQKCLLSVRMEGHLQTETIRLLQNSWIHESFCGTQDDDTTSITNLVDNSGALLSPAAVKAICKALRANVAIITSVGHVDKTGGTAVDNREEKSIVSVHDTSPSLSSDPQRNPKSSTWIDGLVSFVHRKVQETIRQVRLAKNNPHFVSQIILSLTFTILSWRQRKNLKVILSYILLPVRELLDALKAQ